MRYTTYESQKEKISLKEEIDYIKSMIELEQLRHEGEFMVVFEIDETIHFHNIPPLILFPLVENALKHGHLDKDHPLQIYITCSKEALNFKVRNTISDKKKNAVRRIGHQNLKKRLDIYFPKKHTLETYRKDEVYFAELEINFK
jgi:LytS/YehU family sensor histidine kinase